MKLINAIKNERGNPFEIPDCSRDDLPELFKELGFQTGAEIGVSVGYNLELYCKAGFKMFGIDPYVDYEDNRFRTPFRLSRLLHTNIDNADKLYYLAIKKLAPYPNCTLIRKMSMDALADIPDRSLDFVYIDGNHSYGYVAMDLMKWSQKVRKNGIIAGHDYYSLKGNKSTRQVGAAVDGFVKSFNFDNWYILGLKNSVPGYRTDEDLSFMMFKHW
jgi:hypothetical protein